MAVARDRNEGRVGLYWPGSQPPAVVGLVTAELPKNDRNTTSVIVARGRRYLVEAEDVIDVTGLIGRMTSGFGRA